MMKHKKALTSSATWAMGMPEAGDNHSMHPFSNSSHIQLVHNLFEGRESLRSGLLSTAL